MVCPPYVGTPSNNHMHKAREAVIEFPMIMEHGLCGWSTQQQMHQCQDEQEQHQDHQLLEQRQKCSACGSLAPYKKKSMWTCE